MLILLSIYLQFCLNCVHSQFEIVKTTASKRRRALLKLPGRVISSALLSAFTPPMTFLKVDPLVLSKSNPSSHPPR